MVQQAIQPTIQPIGAHMTSTTPPPPSIPTRDLGCFNVCLARSETMSLNSRRFQMHYQLHPNSRKRTRSMEGVNKLGTSFFAVNFCTIRLFKYLWVSATLTICLRYPQIDIDVYCPVYIPDASTCPMLIWMEAWSSALMTLFVAELIFVKC